MSGDHDIAPLAAVPLHGDLAIRRVVYVVPGAHQNLVQRPAEQLIIINEQNTRHNGPFLPVGYPRGRL